MDNKKNNSEFELLMRDPGMYVAGKQDVIGIIVSRYIKHGYIPFKDKDDAIQYVNFSLLDGIVKKMQEQYNPSYFLSTYFASIVNNILKNYVREMKSAEPFNIDDAHKYRASSDNTFRRMVIEEEIFRLEMILQTYNRKRLLLLIVLKLYFRIPVTEAEIRELTNNKENSSLPEFPEKDREILLNVTDTKLFEDFSRVLNPNEDAKKGGAALKRWVYVKIHEIIDLLNGDAGTGAYDADTFEILFYEFCEKKSK